MARNQCADPFRALDLPGASLPTKAAGCATAVRFQIWPWHHSERLYQLGLLTGNTEDCGRVKVAGVSPAPSGGSVYLPFPGTGAGR